MENQDDLQILAKGYWPQLAVVVLCEQQYQPDLSQCQSVDSLQLVARFDLWQPRPQKPGPSWWTNAKSSVLLVASKAQQQQLGLVYNAKSARAALRYLTPLCVDVTSLDLLQKSGTCGILELALADWCSLVSLNFENSKLEPVDMMCLMNTSLLQVQELQLSHNDVGPEGVQVLVSARLPELWKLSLHHAQLDALAAKYLVKGDWPKLSWLSLCDNHLDSMAMMYIADGCWPELQDLDIHGNPSDALRLQRLMKGRWPWLYSLTVGSTMLSPASLALLDVHAMPQLLASGQSKNSSWYQNKKRF